VFYDGKLAVFVDGCFWHGCKVHRSIPKSNAAFWSNKIAGNVRRDAAVRRRLNSLGWSVLRVWQHDLRDVDKVGRRVSLALARLRSRRN
jgi:DNA mismatch endonuclease (patch repair protein)